ncbi:hypothetical protein P3T27_005768 [Kitasatospora sp. MAA19]|nr:hypothetical protein [Kitasatospora sp. MAA19]
MSGRGAMGGRGGFVVEWCGFGMEWCGRVVEGRGFVVKWWGRADAAAGLGGADA